MKEIVSSNKRRISPISIYLREQPIIDSFKIKVMSSGSCFASAISEQFSELGIYSFFDTKTCCRFSAASFADYFRYLSNDKIDKVEERLHISGSSGTQLIRSTSHAELCEHVSNRQKIIDTINKTNKEFTYNLKTADIIIFTLGTTRYLRDKNTGQILNTQEGLDKNDYEIVIPTTEDLLSDIKFIITSIYQLAKPTAKIFLTVSPQRYSWEPIGDFKDGRDNTLNDFSSIPYDGIVNNCYDKSRLRVNLQEAIEELQHVMSNIFYFPSYEIVIEELRHLENFGIKENDYGHVSKDTSSYVVNRFLNAYMSEPMKIFIDSFKKNQPHLEHRFYHKNSEEFVSLIEQYSSLLSEFSALEIPSIFYKKIESAIEKYKKNMDQCNYDRLINIKKNVETNFNVNTIDIDKKCRQIDKIDNDAIVFIYGVGITAEYLLQNSMLLKKNVQGFLQSQPYTADYYFGHRVYEIGTVDIPINSVIVIASMGSFDKIRETIKSNGGQSLTFI